MKQAGVTLIELMVVIAIIGMMSTLMLNSTNSSRQHERVKAAAAQLIDIAKETRQMAVSVEEFRDEIFPSYGIHITSTQNNSQNQRIIIFANCVLNNNDSQYIDHEDDFFYDESANACSNSSGETFPSVFRTHKLKNNVFVKEIRAIYTDDQMDGSDQLIEENVQIADITYVRPEPTIWMTYFKGANPKSTGHLISAGRFEVTLTDQTESFEKTVIFYSSGLMFSK